MATYNVTTCNVNARLADEIMLNSELKFGEKAATKDWQKSFGDC